MTCYIWFENDTGFKIIRYDEPPSLEAIAESVPDPVDIIELMNKAAIGRKMVDRLVGNAQWLSVEFQDPEDLVDIS